MHKAWLGVGFGVINPEGNCGLYGCRGLERRDVWRRWWRDRQHYWGRLMQEGRAVPVTQDREGGRGLAQHSLMATGETPGTGVSFS